METFTQIFRTATAAIASEYFLLPIHGRNLYTETVSIVTNPITRSERSGPPIVFTGSTVKRTSEPTLRIAVRYFFNNLQFGLFSSEQVKNTGRIGMYKKATTRDLQQAERPRQQFRLPTP